MTSLVILYIKWSMKFYPTLIANIFPLQPAHGKYEYFQYDDQIQLEN